MPKPMKSIEEQVQDIVNITSFFPGIEVQPDLRENFVLVVCPDYKLWDVLTYYFLKNGYQVSGEHTNTSIGQFIFRIKLLPPTFTPEQLVLKMVEYLRTLDNIDAHPIKLSARSNAATELLKFLESIGIDEKLFD